MALCITELDPGGAESQLVRLATNLDRRLFEPEVICLSGEGPLVAPLREAGLPVTCLHARGRWDLGVIGRLRRHLRRTRPDLLQSFLFHANIAGRIAARTAGVPVVLSGVRVAERRRWQLRLDRATDRLVDIHVCVSRSVAEHSARVAGIPPEKLVVIPNAVDAERFAHALPADLTEFGFPRTTKLVLFVGRLDRQKDPVRLLDEFRLLAARRGDVGLLIVGTGPLEGELRRRAADLGKRVVLAGYRNDVPALLKASACLGMTSRWEGMPNVVLEAVAAGVPVVATPAEGIKEVLLDSLGTVVQGEAAGAFADALEEIIDENGSHSEHRREQQQTILSRHTTKTVVGEYQRLYLGRLATARHGDPGTTAALFV